MFMDQLRSQKDFRNNYFERIVQEPDQKLYLNMDLLSYDDPQFHQKDLYSYNLSINSYKAPVINDLEFRMPPFPPFFVWNKLPQVKHLF